MNNPAKDIDQLLLELRALSPPKRRNIHSPAFQAQRAIFSMLNGEAVSLSEAMWRQLPHTLRFNALRPIRTPKHGFVYGLKPNGHAIEAAGHWLLHCGWSPATATCKPTKRGGGASQ